MGTEPSDDHAFPEVLENMHDNMEVRSSRVVHKLGNYIDCIRNVRMCHT